MSREAPSSRSSDSLSSRRFTLYVGVSLAVHLLMGSFLLFATIRPPSPSDMPEPIKVSLASKPPGPVEQPSEAQNGPETDPATAPPELDELKLEKVEPPVKAEEKPEPRTNVAPEPEKSVPEKPAQKKGVAKVTTPKLPDSANFGYPYYLSWLQRQLYEAWLYPSELASGKKVLRAVMALVIRRDGGIDSTKLEESSGNDVFDRSVIRAVEAAAPFPPLPDGYEKDTLGTIFISFEYHE